MQRGGGVAEFNDQMNLTKSKVFLRTHQVKESRGISQEKVIPRFENTCTNAVDVRLRCCISCPNTSLEQSIHSKTDFFGFKLKVLRNDGLDYDLKPPYKTGF